MKKKSDIAGYTLEKNYILKDVCKLQKRLQNLLDSNASHYEMDASNVAAIDIAGLQLLTVFASALKKNSANVSWKNPSAVFSDSVNLLQLDKCIEL